MTQVLRFGSAEVHPEERQLLVDGQAIGLGARAFDVLMTLLAHRSRVVSKDELIDAVWPGVVVEENNLHVQISTLRKVLGAGTITTIAGRGYQFTAHVESGALDRPAPASESAGAASRRTPRALRASFVVAIVCAIAIAAGSAVVLARRSPWFAARTAGAAPASIANSSAPAHSVAVLPFANMSGEARDDYFSDGLSEELLNSLGTIHDLHVAARTSSFSFKGSETAIPEIGRKLNVAAILEGSVRRDGNRVRITATLIDAASGYHLWSQSYDRDLKNILALQTEVAASVTSALSVALLADTLETLGQGGTQNPEAFDAYLRGERYQGLGGDRETALAQIAAYDEAIKDDPTFAKAYVGKARALTALGRQGLGSGAEVRRAFEEARSSAQTAVQLAPALARAHAALGHALASGFFDYPAALAEYDRALALSSGDAQVLLEAAVVYALMGRSAEAAQRAADAVRLDPLNAIAYREAGWTYLIAHRYRESVEAYDRALALHANTEGVTGGRGVALLALGEIEAARKACATPPLNYLNQVCLSVVYQRLHNSNEALAHLATLKNMLGDNAAYQLVEVYAQWGDTRNALDWLDTAYREHDPGLNELKTDVLVDPLRHQPRFAAIERDLHFPS